MWCCPWREVPTQHRPAPHRAASRPSPDRSTTFRGVIGVLALCSPCPFICTVSLSGRISRASQPICHNLAMCDRYRTRPEESDWRAISSGDGKKLLRSPRLSKESHCSLSLRFALTGPSLGLAQSHRILGFRNPLNCPPLQSPRSGWVRAGRPLDKPLAILLRGFSPGIPGEAIAVQLARPGRRLNPDHAFLLGKVRMVFCSGRLLTKRGPAGRCT